MHMTLCQEPSQLIYNMIYGKHLEISCEHEIQIHNSKKPKLHNILYAGVSDVKQLTCRYKYTEWLKNFS